MKIEKIFEGNLVFASKNTLKMISTSRRDDLMSLCYLMLYLVDGKLPFLVESADDSFNILDFEKEKFDIIMKLKNKLTAREMCSSIEG